MGQHLSGMVIGAMRAILKLRFYLRIGSVMVEAAVMIPTFPLLSNETLVLA